MFARYVRRVPCDATAAVHLRVAGVAGTLLGALMAFVLCVYLAVYYFLLAVVVVKSVRMGVLVCRACCGGWGGERRRGKLRVRREARVAFTSGDISGGRW